MNRERDKNLSEILELEARRAEILQHLREKDSSTDYSASKEALKSYKEYLSLHNPEFAIDFYKKVIKKANIEVKMENFFQNIVEVIKEVDEDYIDWNGRVFKKVDVLEYRLAEKETHRLCKETLSKNEITPQEDYKENFASPDIKIMNEAHQEHIFWGIYMRENDTHTEWENIDDIDNLYGKD